MDRGYRFRWLAALLVVGLMAAVGIYSYNVGWAQGVASGAAVAAPGAVPLVPMYRPWGWGFGFFPFFPLFFILFWFVILRGLFWRSHWRHRWDERGVPPAFEEWHRRAHAADQSTSK
jgi:hypothetical protein